VAWTGPGSAGNLPLPQRTYLQLDAVAYCVRVNAPSSLARRRLEALCIRAHRRAGGAGDVDMSRCLRSRKSLKGGSADVRWHSEPPLPKREDLAKTQRSGPCNGPGFSIAGYWDWSPLPEAGDRKLEAVMLEGGS